MRNDQVLLPAIILVILRILMSKSIVIVAFKMEVVMARLEVMHVKWVGR